MKNMVYPEHYRSALSQRDTQRAIKIIKDTFQQALSQALNLDRVTAPVMVTRDSGINDDLNGVERKVHFTMKGTTTATTSTPSSWTSGTGRR